MPRLRALVSVLASLGALPAFAQTGDDFVPVTDRMLERPDARRLAHVAAHAERLGL